MTSTKLANKKQELVERLETRLERQADRIDTLQQKLQEHDKSPPTPAIEMLQEYIERFTIIQNSLKEVIQDLQDTVIAPEDEELFEEYVEFINKGEIEHDQLTELENHLVDQVEESAAAPPPPTEEEQQPPTDSQPVAADVPVYAGGATFDIS